MDAQKIAAHLEDARKALMDAQCALNATLAEMSEDNHNADAIRNLRGLVVVGAQSVVSEAVRWA